jgi:hypothetical protein
MAVGTTPSPRKPPNDELAGTVDRTDHDSRFKDRGMECPTDMDDLFR